MNEVILYIIVMAGVTYLVRALPLLLIRRQITNVFIHSFLYYVPYVTLSVMIFPAVLYSTARIESAAIGALAAVILALRKGSLIHVSALGCLAVFLTELLLN